MLSFRNRLLILLIGLVVGAETVTLFTALARTSTHGARPGRRAAGGRCAHRAAAAGVPREAAGQCRGRADLGLRAARGRGLWRSPDCLLRPCQSCGHESVRTSPWRWITEGQVIARGDARGAVDPALLAALSSDIDRPGKARFIVAPSGAWQVFVSPVLAPDEIGRDRTGFRHRRATGARAARSGGRGCGLPVGCGRQPARCGHDRRAHAQGGLPRCSAALRSSPATISIGGEEYLATATHLAASGRTPLDVALFKPMQQVMAPYRELALNLGLIIGVTLAAAVDRRHLPGPQCSAPRAAAGRGRGAHRGRRLLAGRGRVRRTRTGAPGRCLQQHAEGHRGSRIAADAHGAA